jgi:hypothetical protein
MTPSARLAPVILPVAALLAMPALAQEAQLEPEGTSRTEAMQIGDPAERDAVPGSAYLDHDRTPAPAAPRISLMQASSDQITRPSGNTPTSQITSRTQSGTGMAQLSKADLDATLAQLSAVERRVLLQAIEGTDICDNPPNVAAILALCQNRLETHSQDFAEMAERTQSAEERLLNGNLESTTLPSVGQVIERLARGSAATNDFSNQAIASIALAPPPTTPTRPGDEEETESTSFSEEAQALVNALINQLTGGSP